MAIKKLRSNLELKGIAPNLLLKDVENTAPFLFKGEINCEGKEREYLAKLVYYKKNLNALKHINLSEYFHICMAAHWATAGTFVPTNVDNQIREGLWKHPNIGGQIDRMGRITVDSWKWDYSEVTNRKSYSPRSGVIMSTHEGTWLSVAIGAYCALTKHKKTLLSEEVASVIIEETRKEEQLLEELREARDHVNFLRSTALMAHNFGDLDRVIDQWNMPADDHMRLSIYKLGHQLNEHYSPILAYAGQVNKALLSVENHRHMSMRGPRCLRRSRDFLIPVGPFMYEWGQTLGSTSKLTLDEKGEIVANLYEGYKRQDHAFGYARAFNGLINALPAGLMTLEAHLPFDLVLEIKKSKFFEVASMSEDEFIELFKKKLEEFTCPLTQLRF